MIEKEIRTRLLSQDARIFWDNAPEQTPKPYIVLYTIGGEVDLGLAAPIGIQRILFQVSVFGVSGEEVRHELALVRGLLHYWQGPAGTHTIQSCVATREAIVQFETNPELYHGSQDYEVIYT